MNSISLLVCRSCGLSKPTDDFYADKRNTSGKRQPCKSCVDEQNAVWRTNNIDRWNEYSRQYALDHPHKRRENHLKTRWRLTLESYAAILDSQGGVCAICGETPGDISLHVDHDHSCCPGKSSCGVCVRGLLCYRCNSAVGLMRDNVEILKSAVRYLS